MSNVLLTFDFEPEWSIVGRNIHDSLWAKKFGSIGSQLDWFLDQCNEKNIKTTIFVVSKIAKHYKTLLREALDHGHEIASHSHTHVDLFGLELSSLRFEIIHSKELLQDLLGVQILGFRAPRFRLCDRGLDIVNEAGYKYDSSFISEKYTPYDQENVSVEYLRPGLAELPFKKHKIFSKNISILGGGYFRLTPKTFLSQIDMGTYSMFYVHAHDFNSFTPFYSHMTLKDFILRNLRSSSTKSKVKSFFSRKDINFVNCKDYLSSEILEFGH